MFPLPSRQGACPLTSARRVTFSLRRVVSAGGPIRAAGTSSDLFAYALITKHGQHLLCKHLGRVETVVSVAPGST